MEDTGKDTRVARLAPLGSEGMNEEDDPGRRLPGAVLPGATLRGTSGAKQGPRFAREFTGFRVVFHNSRNNPQRRYFVKRIAFDGNNGQSGNSAPPNDGGAALPRRPELGLIVDVIPAFGGAVINHGDEAAHDGCFFFALFTFSGQ